MISVMLLIGIFALPVYSFVPEQINYQGKLTDDTGTEVADGTYTITFTLYDELNAVAWTETQPAVSVVKGLFSTKLPLNPGASPFPAGLFDEELFLGITVDSDAEMSPRQQLTTVPFSFKARDADTIAGQSPSAFAEALHVHDFADLLGTVSDAQVPDNISVDQAASASDADNLDGRDSSSFADAGHDHNFSAISGQVTDGQVPNNITIDYAAGAGNADTVDGQHASAFMAVGTDNWVNTSGDTMYGRLETESTIIGSGWGEAIKGILNTTENCAGVYGISEGSIHMALPVVQPESMGPVSTERRPVRTAWASEGAANGTGGIGVYGEGPGWAGYFLNRVRMGQNIWTSGKENGIYFGDGSYVFVGEKDGDDQLTLKAGKFYFENGEVELADDLIIPNNSDIKNTTGRAVFHTGWASLFGDYTTINSGYDWGSGEPVSVVAGSNGVFFTKGDDTGTPHSETLAKIDNSGMFSCNVLEIKGGMDLAEPFDVLDQEGIEPGMLMSIDPSSPGRLTVTDQPYDLRVAG